MPASVLTKMMLFGATSVVLAAAEPDVEEGLDIENQEDIDFDMMPEEDSSDEYGANEDMQEEDLQAQFDSIDSNLDGFISRAEAAAMGNTPEETESINDFFLKTDIDPQDDKISFPEYEAFAHRLEQQQDEDRIAKTRAEFEEADSDNNGRVTKEEVMNLVDSDVPEEDVHEFFKHADANGDNEITLDEYEAYARSMDNSDPDMDDFDESMMEENPDL